MLTMMNQGRAAETACDAFGRSMVDETSSEHHFPSAFNLLLPDSLPMQVSLWDGALSQARG